METRSKGRGKGLSFSLSLELSDHFKKMDETRGGRGTPGFEETGFKLAATYHHTAPPSRFGAQDICSVASLVCKATVYVHREVGRPISRRGNPEMT